MENPIKYSNQNIIESINFINVCITNNIKNFIFSSSAAVYGFPQYLRLDEIHPLNPIQTNKTHVSRECRTCFARFTSIPEEGFIPN